MKFLLLLLASVAFGQEERIEVKRLTNDQIAKLDAAHEKRTSAERWAKTVQNDILKEIGKEDRSYWSYSLPARDLDFNQYTRFKDALLTADKGVNEEQDGILEVAKELAGPGVEVELHRGGGSFVYISGPCKPKDEHLSAIVEIRGLSKDSQWAVITYQRVRKVDCSHESAGVSLVLDGDPNWKFK